jgi:HEAT repeat protein
MQRVLLALALIAAVAGSAAAEPIPLAQERRVVDRLLAGEYRRLVSEIEDPATPGDNRRSAYYRIAELGTPDAVDFLRRTYEQRKRAGTLYPGGERDAPDLVFMLWNIPTPESAAVLLRMIRDGHRDLRLVTAYAAVAGEAALPELRLMVKNGRNEDIRVGARQELIRLGDEAAVEDLLRRLEPPAPNERDLERVETAVGNVVEARAAAAIPALRRLSDHFGPRDASRLHHRIVHALLFLRDRQSVPRAIALLEAAPPQAAQELGLRGTGGVLADMTGQRFGDDAAAWRRWWDETGKHAGNLAPPAPGETADVEAAFLAWAKSPAAGPVVPGPVVYVQDPSGKRVSTESVRYNRESELGLLGVPRIRIDEIRVEADRGRVNFYGPTDRHGRGRTAGLVKDARGWSVRGYVKNGDDPGR